MTRYIVSCIFKESIGGGGVGVGVEGCLSPLDHFSYYIFLSRFTIFLRCIPNSQPPNPKRHINNVPSFSYVNLS